MNLWALPAFSYFCTVSWLSGSEQSPRNTCISSASIIHPVGVGCATLQQIEPHRVSHCCQPVRGNRTRWGCCSCNGIQRGRAEALLQGKHRGFILPGAQMHTVLFFFFFPPPPSFFDTQHQNSYICLAVTNSGYIYDDIH